MKMKKFVMSFSVALAATTVITGCSSGPSGRPNGRPDGQSATTTTTVVETVPDENVKGNDEGDAAAESTREPKNEGDAATESTTEPSEKVEAENDLTAEEYVTITDHMDRTVTLKANPKTCVVLDIYPLPSVLCLYLNSADSILAMEPASMNAAKSGTLSEIYPEILNTSTEIMNGEDVNIEAVMDLNPDVVYFNAGNADLAAQLENAGLNAVAFSATKFGFDAVDTYDQWVGLLAQIYPDNAKAELVSDKSNEILELIAKDAAKIEEEKKVLFLFQYDDTKMITSGNKFWGQYWCDSVNAENVAGALTEQTTNAKITMEQVYEWDPEVIIITNFTPVQPQDLYDNAIGADDWSSVTAVKNRQVYKMPLGVYRTYTPGVDTPMTIEWLAKTIYPEYYESIDLESDVKKYYNDIYGVTLSDEQIKKMYNPSSNAGSMND